MILPQASATDSVIQPPRVGIGQTGVAISELRPIGICEFDHERHEARGELGPIRAGEKVKVVRIDEGRIIVRPVEV